MAAPWRNCRASITLADEINRRWPGRDRASDGTIGDAAHATRTSDHNPWVVVDGVGVVRARDIDKDGIDAPWLVEHLRQLGARGDRRLAGGGYLIFNRRITKPDFSGWRVYTGANPHTAHVHVSFSRDRAGFDSREPWGIHPAAKPATSNPITEDVMNAEQERLLREVHALLKPVEIVQPDGMRRYVSPMDALVNLYVGMFYGGESTPGRRSLLDLAAQHSPAAVLDPDVLRQAVTAALGGGLAITGTATPITGTAVPATTQKG